LSNDTTFRDRNEMDRIDRTEGGASLKENVVFATINSTDNQCGIDDVHFIGQEAQSSEHEWRAMSPPTVPTTTTNANNTIFDRRQPSFAPRPATSSDSDSSIEINNSGRTEQESLPNATTSINPNTSNFRRRLTTGSPPPMSSADSSEPRTSSVHGI
jgi:hypothetical protein